MQKKIIYLQKKIIEHKLSSHLRCTILFEQQDKVVVYQGKEGDHVFALWTLELAALH